MCSLVATSRMRQSQKVAQAWCGLDCDLRPNEEKNEFQAGNSTWAFPSESSSNYKFRWSPSHVDPSSSHTSTIDKPSTKLVSRMVSKSMRVPRFVCARKIGTPFWVLVSCEVRVIYNVEAQIEDDLSVALLWLGKDMIWSLDSQFLINFEFALLQWCFK